MSCPLSSRCDSTSLLPEGDPFPFSGSAREEDPQAFPHVQVGGATEWTAPGLGKLAIVRPCLSITRATRLPYYVAVCRQMHVTQASRPPALLVLPCAFLRDISKQLRMSEVDNAPRQAAFEGQTLKPPRQQPFDNDFNDAGGWSISM